MNPSDIKRFLPLVRKPARYIGGEINSVKKDLSRVRLKFGMAFPDAYEVGMSHLGIQILYQTLNAREDIACERAFAPWTDMERLLRGKGIKLSTLESNIPLDGLDILGFSLQYELSYTNVLNMLELGGVPLYSSDRKDTHPFVIGGGPIVYNPEPVAVFFDAFLLGDGEEAVLEISDAVIEGRQKGEDRVAILKRLSKISGVYVPSFFDIKYNADGTVKKAVPLVEGYERVRKRIVPDINALPLPERPVVPFLETIHDRVTVEITRGCTRSCRFCQAGMIYRPARERRPELISKLALGALKSTGYDEVSLLSLSAGDYTLIEGLLAMLMRGFVEENVALSLPSLRVGTLNSALAGEIKKVRKTGFTLAPEAGSERLRLLINKGITEEDLLKGAKEIFALGWRSLKLYFMIGLPTETDGDVNEIVRLAACVKRIGKEASGGRAPQINAAAATFIPKPFTPFQWEAQLPYKECVAKQARLKKSLEAMRVDFKWHDPSMSVLEGVFSRGDRRLEKALVNAFKKGCRFDGWSDEFSFALWEEAFKEEGIDMAFYTSRQRQYDEVFAWDHLDAGINKEFLLRELKKAMELSATPDCKVDRCSACGVCDHKTIKNVLAGGADALNQAEAQGRAKEGQKQDKTEVHKINLRFSKNGDMRFLGHLELVTAVTRAFRRAGIPVKYSQGFHPLPKFVFSQPLPVGIESSDEWLTAELEGARITAEDVVSRLNKELPQGIRILSAAYLPLKVSHSSGIIKEIEYLAFLNGGPEGELTPTGLNIRPESIDGILREFLSKESAVVSTLREGKSKEVDIRPLVAALAHSGGGTIRLVLKKGQTASARPADVLASVFNLSHDDASLIPVLKIKTIQ